MGSMFVPRVVIKLLSVLGRGFCCCNSIVCYNFHCVSGVYVCSSCCDKADVCSGDGGSVYLSHGLYLHCVSGVYVFISCCDKAAVCSGEGVLLLQVHCL